MKSDPQVILESNYLWFLIIIKICVLFFYGLIPIAWKPILSVSAYRPSLEWDICRLGRVGGMQGYNSRLFSSAVEAFRLYSVLNYSILSIWNTKLQQPRLVKPEEEAYYISESRENIFFLFGNSLLQFAPTFSSDGWGKVKLYTNPDSRRYKIKNKKWNNETVLLDAFNIILKYGVQWYFVRLYNGPFSSLAFQLKTIISII